MEFGKTGKEIASILLHISYVRLLKSIKINYTYNLDFDIKAKRTSQNQSNRPCDYNF